MAKETAKEIDIHNVVNPNAHARQAFPRCLYKPDPRPEAKWGPDHPGFITKTVDDEDALDEAIEDGWSTEHLPAVEPKRTRGAKAAKPAQPAAAASGDAGDDTGGDAPPARTRKSRGKK